MNELLTLCIEFFKTGLFAVGGGLATLPFLTRMQQQYGWFTAEELANMIAVGESSLIVVLIIAKAMDRYQKSPLVQNMFAFMRPAVTGLIAAAGFEVLKIALLNHGEGGFSINPIAVALYALLVVLIHLKAFKKLHPIVFIAAGAVAGIILQM